MTDQSDDPNRDAAHAEADKTTHFGYREVRAADKARLVRDVFDRVAPRYDLMNDLMSLGLHRLWKKALLAELRPQPDMRLLDLGGGTGDIAFGFRGQGGGPVVVVDINQAMLITGRDRAIDRNIVGGIEWICGDAEALPLPDRAMSACTIAFALRNVTGIEAALAEAHRVLKPGGRFLCLEFSKMALPGLAALYDRYSFSVLPRLGKLIAGDEDAYRYLAESIRRFPPQPDLARMMETAGFAKVRWTNLSGGIVALHSGWRI
jgi:demethylmenaquinone methyltransferase/2-methoxy-6-polyprenyl-1,4-benzoquinol methylase